MAAAQDAVLIHAVAAPLTVSGSIVAPRGRGLPTRGVPNAEDAGWPECCVGTSLMGAGLTEGSGGFTGGVGAEMALGSLLGSAALLDPLPSTTLQPHGTEAEARPDSSPRFLVLHFIRRPFRPITSGAGTTVGALHDSGRTGHRRRSRAGERDGALL